MKRVASFFAVSLAVFSVGCKKDTPAPAVNTGDAQATALAPSVSAAPLPSAPARGSPVPSASIAATVNPENLSPYAGPTGSVEGRITVVGDPAPSLGIDFKKCPEGEKVYGKAFRDGAPLPDGSRPLADALVVITGYTGFYLPERNESKLVTVENCAITPRTIDLTFGQRLEVQNRSGDNKKLFAPAFMNHALPALMIAANGADPVKLWPVEPGYDQLVDKMTYEFMANDVYTLVQPLHTVTKLDGTYRIDNVPVGKLEVHTRLRTINRDASKPVEVRANVVSRVDLQMEYRANEGGAAALSADAGPRRVLIK